MPPTNPQRPSTLSHTQIYQTVVVMLTRTAAPRPAQPSLTPIPAGQTLPTHDPTLAQPAPPTQTSAAVAAHSPAPICDRAAAGYPKIDVTIDDNTILQPGQAFTKVWRLTNVGDCTWTQAYTVRFSHGDQMGAPLSVALSEEVPNGQTVEITLDMVSPLLPGTYRGNWKLQNPAGVMFGIGPNGNAPFWVQIVVVAPPTLTDTPTETPTTTPTPTATPSPTPSPTVTPVVQASGQIVLLPDSTLDLDTLQLEAGESGDLLYQVDQSNNHLLVPLTGALLGVWGRLQPQMADCQSASMGTAAIATESLLQGVYLCVRTSDGRPGWIQYLSFSSADDTTTLNISVWAP